MPNSFYFKELIYKLILRAMRNTCFRQQPLLKGMTYLVRFRDETDEGVFVENIQLIRPMRGLP